MNFLDAWGLEATDETAYYIPIVGAGVTHVAGGNVEAGIVWDTAGNIGIALSGDVGVGVSAEVDLPISEIIALIITNGTSVESIPGIIQDFEGPYSEVSVHVIAGITKDLDNPEDTNFSIDTVIGGGTYLGYTIVIEIIDGDGK